MSHTHITHTHTRTRTCTHTHTHAHTQNVSHYQRGITISPIKKIEYFILEKYIYVGIENQDYMKIVIKVRWIKRGGFFFSWDVTHSCVRHGSLVYVTWFVGFVRKNSEWGPIYIVRCRVVQCVVVGYSLLQCVAVCYCVLQCATVCCSVLLCVAELQCVARVPRTAK